MGGQYLGKPWTAPEPRQLPNWRAQIIEHTESMLGMQSVAVAINQGQATIVPLLQGHDHSEGAIASQLLSRLEAKRLREAALYYATGDMTALALAAASTPPSEPVRESRLPAPVGLMLFESPIGGYDVHLPDLLGGGGMTNIADITVTTPIVAVSWSVWTPGDVEVTGARQQPTWVHNSPDGVTTIPGNYRGIWLTFYAPSGGSFAALPPSTVVAHYPDGTAATAHDLATGNYGAALQWDNEMVLALGKEFGPPRPDTSQEWAQVIYTAWQLIGQSGGGNPLTSVELEPRDRAGRRRDERAGLATDGVRVVHVHSAHRPPKAAADQDAEASSGRRAPSWTCRWPVRPYRRSTCLNPRAHADGGCEHEDRIVPAHIKGPTDKPLRLAETVNLWDSQPDEP